MYKNKYVYTYAYILYQCLIFSKFAQYTWTTATNDYPTTPKEDAVISLSSLSICIAEIFFGVLTILH